MFVGFNKMKILIYRTIFQRFNKQIDIINYIVIQDIFILYTPIQNSCNG